MSPVSGPSTRRNLRLVSWTGFAPAIVFALLCAIELAAILTLNHGTFTYTLDDPYLHLALAEGICRGSYGLNPGEAAAPASSFLWPFLLAPLAGFPFHHLVPLTVALLASIATIAIYARIAESALRDAPPAASGFVAPLLVTWLVIATNLIGLVFTGMEHSLQVLLSAALVRGLIGTLETGRAPRWLPLVLVLGPWVRYENLALSLPAVALLAWRRQTAVALGSLAGIVLGLGWYSLFLHSTGSGWLPASVVAKSRVVAGGASLGSLVHNLRLNLRPGLPLIACGAALALVAARGRSLPERVLAAWAAAAVALHLVAGRFGWFARYEIYIWSAALLALMLALRGPLSRWAADGPTWAAATGLALALAIACRPYIEALALTPLAANNIYEQQYQLRRFAADLYAAPVAANDLGLVSYRNDHYVLDLEGLSSSETRLLRRGSSGTAWMDSLCRRHGVHVAAIYGSVFPSVPESWVRLGDLRLGKPRITPGDSVLAFWAVDSAAAAVASQPIRTLFDELPRGVRGAVAWSGAPR